MTTTTEPANVYMQGPGGGRAYTSERLFRDLYEPQGWTRQEGAGSSVAREQWTPEGVEAVLGMELLDPREHDAEWAAGYNACLRVVREYLGEPDA